MSSGALPLKWSFAGPPRWHAVGLLGVVSLAACLLPSEPSDAELVQFQLQVDQPFRVPLNGAARPAIAVVLDGKVLKPASYRLEALDNRVVRVDTTGQELRGLARGITPVRVVVATAIGSRDTVFPVQVVVSSVLVYSQDTAATHGPSPYASLTRLGQTAEFRATAHDVNGVEVPNVPFTWATSDSLVAKLVGPGLVVAVDEGYATISAEVDGVRGWGYLAVLQDAAAVIVAPDLDTLRTVGRSTSFLALVFDSTNRIIRAAKPHWSSSDTAVARVSRLGLATATGPGTARIIARVGGAADTATLVVAQVARFLFVSPGLLTLTAVGDTARLAALASDSLAFPMPNPSVTWAVGDASIATVDATGLVTARKNGAVIVTATSARQSAFATVAVRQELARVSIVEESVALTGEGATLRLHVEGLDRNGYLIANVDQAALVWRGRFALVATVDSTGLVTAHTDGTTRVTVSITAAKDAPSDTAVVTVVGAPHELIAFDSPLGIEVTRADGSLRSVLIPHCGYGDAYRFDEYQNLCGGQPDASVSGSAWSPDGARLAFERAVAGEREIYAARADGSGFLNLTKNDADDRGGTWSPDGTKIAFWSNRATGGGIYVMNADGSNVTFLKGNLALPSLPHPTWSPDGSRLAFDEACRVRVMNSDGTGVLDLTHDTPPGSCSYAPAWSPDGSQLAFVRSDDIWLMNADGSGATNLSQGRAGQSDFTPAAWSPDGSRIVFAARTCYGDDYYYYYQCDPARLYVMNKDGTGLRRLTTSDGGSESRPSWRRATPLEAPHLAPGRQP